MKLKDFIKTAMVDDTTVYTIVSPSCLFPSRKLHSFMVEPSQISNRKLEMNVTDFAFDVDSYDAEKEAFGRAWVNLE